MPVTQSTEDRFLAKVRKTDDCWLWTAAFITSGYPYGLFRMGKGGMKLAHRVSYELFVGTIPDGLCVLHRCDIPSCVRPDHLFLGTYADNNQDASRKGRARTSPRPGESNPAAKFTAEEVKAIWNAYAAGGITQAELAKMYNTSQPVIGGIVRGESWSTVTGGAVSSAGGRRELERRNRVANCRRGEGHPFSKLTEKDVLEIKRLASVDGLSGRKISSLFGVSVSVVCDILRGDSWSHVTWDGQGPKP